MFHPGYLVTTIVFGSMTHVDAKLEISVKSLNICIDDIGSIIFINNIFILALVSQNLKTLFSKLLKFMNNIDLN